MLRTALLSLLLGLASSLGTIALLFPPAQPVSGKQASLSWQINDSHVVAGTLTSGDDSLPRLLANDQGILWLRFPLDDNAASVYRYLHLSMKRHPLDMKTTLVWKRTDTEEVHSELLETLPRESLWIHLGENPGWDASVDSLSLVFQAAGGAEIGVTDISLHQPSRRIQLAALVNDWTSAAPWRNTSINSYSGVTRFSPMYPAPFAALVLLFSLLAFAVLHALRQGRTTPDWRSLGLVCLLCWIGVDALWQLKLGRQLAETHRQFAGKSSEDKLAAGPDAELYRFASDARTLIEPRDARVFVSSSNDYRGLRSAYYFYPFNVHWELRGQELPPPRALKSGDYVVIVQPSAMRVLEKRGVIDTGRGVIGADILMRNEGKTLLRVR
ncbi:MAG: hypothetical protein R3E54_16875 [Halioglobus sp.]